MTKYRYDKKKDAFVFKKKTLPPLEGSLVRSWREEHPYLVEKIEYGERFHISYEEGTYKPLPLSKPSEEKFATRMLDSDLWRQVEAFFHDVNELTLSRWDRLAKLALNVFLVLAAIGSVVVLIALLNKAGTDVLTTLKGVSSPLLNKTVTMLGG